MAIVRFDERRAFPLVVVPPLATLPPSLIPQIMIMSGENSRINQPNIECLPMPAPSLENQ